MASASVEILFGVSLGLVLGVVPAVVAAFWGGFDPSITERRYARGPVAILASLTVCILGVSMQVIALRVEQGPRVLAAVIVSAGLAIVGFEHGGRIGSKLRRESSGPLERGRSLDASALDAVDASGNVVIAPATVRPIDGYPPVPEPLHSAIMDERWRLPADLPLAELQTRIESKLRQTDALQEAAVTVDPRGNATVAVGVVERALANRVPPDHHAVSLRAFVPESVEPGEEVRIETHEANTDGIVLGTTDHEGPLDSSMRAQSDGDGTHSADGGTLPNSRDRVSLDADRVTVAIPSTALDVVGTDSSKTVAVRSREPDPDVAALSLLERDGYLIRHLTVDAESRRAIETGEVDVLAARLSDETPTEWEFNPSIDELRSGQKIVGIGEQNRLGELVEQPSAVEVTAA